MFIKTKKSSLFQITDFSCISPVSLKCHFPVPTSYQGATLHLYTIYPYSPLTCDNFSHFLIFMIWEFWRVGIRHFVGCLCFLMMKWYDGFGEKTPQEWIALLIILVLSWLRWCICQVSLLLSYYFSHSTLFPFFRSKSLILTHPQEK